MSATVKEFAGLHVPGTPLILYNVWDAGTARAAERAGARAIATGSWSVAAANGFDDGETLPLALALANAERIAAVTDLPVSIDFEGGYSADLSGLERNAALLRDTGAVGCNFEDQRIGGDGIYAVAEQAERIAALRRGAGYGFFINARTDIFLQAPASEHHQAKAEAAIERARAYAEAGANGFFVPGLVDLSLLARIFAASPLPVNFMAFPGAPSAAEVAAAGVARISHGPAPYRLAMQAFEDAARAALLG
jgi:2-methylisocitrate lyase-like PEP mutase family enzyme